MDDLTKADTPVPEPVPPTSDPIPPQATKSGKQSRKISFGALVGVTTVVALLLVGVGYTLYRGAGKEEVIVPPPPPQATGTSLDRTSPVDEKTIDTELKAVDKEVNDLDNKADFNDAELSDKSLGL